MKAFCINLSKCIIYWKLQNVDEKNQGQYNDLQNNKMERYIMLVERQYDTKIKFSKTYL